VPSRRASIGARDASLLDRLARAVYERGLEPPSREVISVIVEAIMANSDFFTTDWAAAEFECPLCQQKTAQFRIYEAPDAPEELTQFRCTECHTYWWDEEP
jgi:DNA-directed RNA polymerase subunit M/transcription elongation factor TFIIS